MHDSCDTAQAFLVQPFKMQKRNHRGISIRASKRSAVRPVGSGIPISGSTRGAGNPDSSRSVERETFATIPRTSRLPSRRRSEQRRLADENGIGNLKVPSSLPSDMYRNWCLSAGAMNCRLGTRSRLGAVTAALTSTGVRPHSSLRSSSSRARRGSRGHVGRRTRMMYRTCCTARKYTYTHARSRPLVCVVLTLWTCAPLLRRRLA